MKDIKFKGYLRKNNKKGIRNKILVIYTVECSKFVAEKIVNHFDDMDIECIGFHGCTDNEYAIKLLRALIEHPNIGGILAVGLGCEYIQAESLANIALNEDKEASWILIQDEGGTKSTIDKGIDIVKGMKEKLEESPRVNMSIEDLVIGAECGGSDYTSGLAGNLVVGHLFDLIVSFKGTTIFEEIVEAVGLRSYLVSRGVDENIKEDIANTYDKAMNYCKSVNQYSISPGNFVGGLSSIEEKSMGALVKSGHEKINGVLKVSEQPTSKGLWLLDTTPDPHWMQFGITNPNDNEGIMALIASGAHLVLFITGRGSVVGSAVSPVVKITGNRNTYRKLIDDMDIDASPILYNEKSINELRDDLLRYIVEISSGKRTKAEELGHNEYFIPYKYQNKKC